MSCAFKKNCFEPHFDRYGAIAANLTLKKRGDTFKLFTSIVLMKISVSKRDVVGVNRA